MVQSRKARVLIHLNDDFNSFIRLCIESIGVKSAKWTGQAKFQNVVVIASNIGKIRAKISFRNGSFSFSFSLILVQNSSNFGADLYQF